MIGNTRRDINCHESSHESQVPVQSLVLSHYVVRVVSSHQSQKNMLTGVESPSHQSQALQSKAYHLENND